MSSVAYLGEFQTEQSVKNKINNLLKENLPEKTSQIRQIKRETQKEYKKAFERIKQAGELVRLIKISQEFIYLQTYRLDIFFLAYFNAHSLFEEIGNRFNYKLDELIYLTGEEIINLFKNKKIDKKEINKRKENYALILENDKWSLLAGEEVKQAVQLKVYEFEVKGMVANRGRARGEAKLIFDLEDMGKVKKGDIIISPMTRPELMSVILKASGIITDFGGILSHAAIVSREFGIPCIVGTEKATRVFKDGDLIELNAYDGVARKISK